MEQPFIQRYYLGSLNYFIKIHKFPDMLPGYTMQLKRIMFEENYAWSVMHWGGGVEVF